LIGGDVGGLVGPPVGGEVSSHNLSATAVSLLTISAPAPRVTTPVVLKSPVHVDPVPRVTALALVLTKLPNHVASAPRVMEPEEVVKSPIILEFAPATTGLASTVQVTELQALAIPLTMAKSTLVTIMRPPSHVNSQAPSPSSRLLDRVQAEPAVAT
jgi:hypothetical protein